jgi:Exonuclease
MSLTSDEEFRATTFVVIDFESTTPAGHRTEPTEVAAIQLRVRDTRLIEIGRFCALMKPPEHAPVTRFDTKQTGITPWMVAHQPPASEVLADLDWVSLSRLTCWSPTTLPPRPASCTTTATTAPAGHHGLPGHRAAGPGHIPRSAFPPTRRPHGTPADPPAPCPTRHRGHGATVHTPARRRCPSPKVEHAATAPTDRRLPSQGQFAPPGSSVRPTHLAGRAPDHSSNLVPARSTGVGRRHHRCRQDPPDHVATHGAPDDRQRACDPGRVLAAG